MKKLLSLLTITTLTASVPAPLLANTPLNRVKRDIGINEMKKLLSLLSVLTISGTGAPTLIAASPYQKQEQNLENLQRIKRDNQKKKQQPKTTTKTETPEDNNHPSTSGTNNRCSSNKGRAAAGNGNRNCSKQDGKVPSVTTDKNDRKEILNEIETESKHIFLNGKSKNRYRYLIEAQIEYFIQTNNIVKETIDQNSNRKMYKIEKHNVQDSYKVIPLNIEGNKLDVILNKSNLYIDGIITYNNGDGTEKKLWYFSDSNLAKNYESSNSNDKYKLFSKILDLEIKTDGDLNNLSYKLDFDSNYNTLASGGENIKINKENIKRALINLSKINENKISEIKSNKKAEAEIKKDFLRVIFTIAEPIRFSSIRKLVNDVLSSSESEPYEIKWQDHKETLTNWDKNSQKYYKKKDKDGTKFSNEELDKIYDIAVLAVKDDEKIRKDNDNLRGG